MFVCIYIYMTIFFNQEKSELSLWTSRTFTNKIALLRLFVFVSNCFLSINIFSYCLLYHSSMNHIPFINKHPSIKFLYSYVWYSNSFPAKDFSPNQIQSLVCVCVLKCFLKIFLFWFMNNVLDDLQEQFHNSYISMLLQFKIKFAVRNSRTNRRKRILSL